MNHRVCSAALAAVCCAGTALGVPQITLVQDYRNLYVEAQGNSRFGGDQSQASYNALDNGDPAPAAWSAGDTVISNGAQSAAATTSGGIDTLIAPDKLWANASAEGTATVFDETAYDAFSNSEAIMQIGFTLNEDSVWNLNAMLLATGNALAEVVLSSGATPGGGELFRYTHLDGTSVNVDVTLSAGDYTLKYRAWQVSWLLAQGQLTSTAELQASFTLVPAPGCAAMALACGLAGLRRRRAR